jgi:ElaB/YqjD/DUF883 family membrane-anchored ribosome-binding protein
MRNNHGKPFGRRNAFMRSISAQSGRVAGEVKQLGRVAVTGAGAAVAGLGEQLGKKGRRYLEAAGHVAGRAGGKIRTFIRGNPVKSLFMALGLGAMVGWLLRRR